MLINSSSRGGAEGGGVDHKEMIKTKAGELSSSDGDGRVDSDGGGGGRLSLGVSNPSGGLSPMAQATIQKHLSGPSKRILLTQSMNKKAQAKDAGTITGNYTNKEVGDV